MMMKMTTTNKLIGLYILGDVCVIILSLIQGDTWLLNTQVAFFCSLLITLASFFAYAGVVKRSVASDTIPADAYEKYYEEEDEGVLEEQPTKAKTDIKEKVKHLSLSYKSALSVYRIAAYGVLFVMMLYLIRHDSLNAIAFFVGLSVVPLSSFLSVLFVKKGFE
jgi:hypothetical protein